LNRLDGRELVGEHEAERAHQAGPVAYGRARDAGAGEVAPDAPPHGLAEEVGDQVPRARDRAADDDDLRAEADDEVRDADAEVTRRLPERGARGLLAGERAVNQLREAHPARVFAASGEARVARDRRPPRRESLPAVVAAAGAGDGRALADDHVAELSGRAPLAAVNLAVED